MKCFLEQMGRVRLESVWDRGDNNLLHIARKTIRRALCRTITFSMPIEEHVHDILFIVYGMLIQKSQNEVSRACLQAETISLVCRLAMIRAAIAAPTSN